MTDVRCEKIIQTVIHCDRDILRIVNVIYWSLKRLPRPMVSAYENVFIYTTQLEQALYKLLKKTSIDFFLSIYISYGYLRVSFSCVADVRLSIFAEGCLPFPVQRALKSAEPFRVWSEGITVSHLRGDISPATFLPMECWWGRRFLLDFRYSDLLWWRR